MKPFPVKPRAPAPAPNPAPGVSPVQSDDGEARGVEERPEGRPVHDRDPGPVIDNPQIPLPVEPEKRQAAAPSPGTSVYSVSQTGGGWIAQRQTLVSGRVSGKAEDLCTPCHKSLAYQYLLAHIQQDQVKGMVADANAQVVK